MMQSQSGSGKTMAFLLSALQKIDPANPQCQAIILLNTRELTRQTADVFDYLTEMMDSATRNICLPDKEPEYVSQFYIGTPVQVENVMGMAVSMKQLDLSKIKILVIDEADQILESNQNNSHLDAVRRIKQMMPSTAQTVLVSATRPDKMVSMEKSLLKEGYSKILIQQDEIPKSITQLYIKMHRKNRLGVIIKIMKELQKGDVTGGFGQAVVFVNRREEAQTVQSFMVQNGVPTGLLMGNIDLEYRDKVIDDFRDFNIRVLVTTDVMARGIDILKINFVINYELPKDENNHIAMRTYIHRVGRCGRFGLLGLALSFVDDYEENEFTANCKKAHVGVEKWDEKYTEQVINKIKDNEQLNKKERIKLHREDED